MRSAASINRALALGLVGLGFVLAQRANLTNVGGEGQIAVGGIAATAVALYGGAARLAVRRSSFVRADARGRVSPAALWGGIAGVLKAKAGTNEVISTLLLSFIAVWMVYGAVQCEALLRQPMTTTATLPESLEIPDADQAAAAERRRRHAAARRPADRARARGRRRRRARAHACWGLRLRAIGLNPVAARRAGMRIAPAIVWRAVPRRRARRAWPAPSCCRATRAA